MERRGRGKEGQDRPAGQGGQERAPVLSVPSARSPGRRERRPDGASAPPSQAPRHLQPEAPRPPGSLTPRQVSKGCPPPQDPRLPLRLHAEDPEFRSWCQGLSARRWPRGQRRQRLSGHQAPQQRCGLGRGGVSCHGPLRCDPRSAPNPALGRPLQRRITFSMFHRRVLSLLMKLRTRQ